MSCSVFFYVLYNIHTDLLGTMTPTQYNICMHTLVSDNHGIILKFKKYLTNSRKASSSKDIQFKNKSYNDKYHEIFNPFI